MAEEPRINGNNNGHHLFDDTNSEDANRLAEQYRMFEMKKAINNLVWIYAPESITLGEAEKIACHIQMMIMAGCETL